MKHSQESGQALVEMCAGIIGMISVFIGIIFVSGISITNIKTLQSSKVNAETTVLNAADSYLIERKDIYSWQYGKDDIPFTGADQPVFNSSNQDNLLGDYLSSGTYSQDDEYTFKPLNDIEMRSDRTPEATFYINSFDNYASAASLVMGYPDSYDTLYSYRRAKGSDRQALQRAIAHWLGIDVNRLHLATQRSNQAYMPNFGRYAPQDVPYSTGTGEEEF